MTQKSSPVSSRARFKHGLLRLLAKFWWLDFVPPLLLALLLFVGLTALVYSGRMSSRLAAQGEAALLAWTLALEPRSSREVDRVHGDATLLVLVEPMELMTLRPSPLARVPDASAADYARVVQRLVDLGVKHIVIDWSVEAHPQDVVYYLPLIEAAATARGRSSLTFAIDPASSFAFPKELAELVEVADNSPCSAPDDAATFCPFVPDDGWIVTKLIAMSGRTASMIGSETSSRQITQLLPMIPPSFVLRWPDRGSLTQYRFGEVLAWSDQQFAKPPRFAFVGANPIMGAANIPKSRLVRGLSDAASSQGQLVSMPFAEFWRGLMLILLQDMLPRFPPAAWHWILAALPVIVVGATLSLFGGLAASLVLWAICLSWILGNAWLALPWGYYVPMFDGLYCGLATLLFGGAVRGSVLSFRKWKTREKHRLHAYTTDLKTNFISLVSHNLNTPVAKMHGMLDLARRLWPGEAASLRLQQALALVTRLELTIKTVLVRAAIDEGRTSVETKTLQSVLKEFQGVAVPLLRRGGVQIEVQAFRDDAEGWSALPVPLDVRAINALLLAFGTRLLRSDLAPQTLRMSVDVQSPSNDPDALSLVVRVQGGDREAGFLPAELADQLITSTVSRYCGRLSYGQQPDRGEVSMELPLHTMPV